MKSGTSWAEQVEWIDKSKLDRRNATAEYHRCGWPGYRKDPYKAMHGYRWKRTDKGTAPFPKAREYQQCTVAAYDQHNEVLKEIDLYTKDDESSGEAEDEEDVKEESKDEDYFEEDSKREGDSDGENVDTNNLETQERNWLY